VVAAGPLAWPFPTGPAAGTGANPRASEQPQVRHLHAPARKPPRVFLPPPSVNCTESTDMLLAYLSSPSFLKIQRNESPAAPVSIVLKQTKLNQRISFQYSKHLHAGGCSPDENAPSADPPPPGL